MTGISVLVPSVATVAVKGETLWMDGPSLSSTHNRLLPFIYATREPRGGGSTRRDARCMTFLTDISDRACGCAETSGRVWCALRTGRGRGCAGISLRRASRVGQGEHLESRLETCYGSLPETCHLSRPSAAESSSPRLHLQ